MLDDDDDDTLPPLAVTCPACGAGPGLLCHAPTVAGRRTVLWVHNARRDLAQGWT
jgi:hypothetical protein